MTDQEIRNKSLDMAFLMLGKEYYGELEEESEISGAGNRYAILTADIERYFREEQHN